ncbi:MAG TPA: HEAT repeat domain-containing protein [Verrucomicrobiae bacterium]|nr:HEAT repeat domain-containing protein [Verrucomicrobiae bacterium]
MNDFIKGNCPHCGQNIEFPSEGTGETVSCPTCGKPFTLAPAFQPQANDETRSDKMLSHEVTIQEAAKPHNTNPSEYTIPAREVQDYSDRLASEKTMSPRLQSHIGNLKNQNKYLRKIAAVALGRSKDPSAVSPLISCLADTEWMVRAQAIQSLGELGFPDAVEALVETLKDSELYLRKAAADALGQIRSDRAVDALMALALEDPKEIVRKAAAMALARIKGGNSTYIPTEASAKAAVSGLAGQSIEQLFKDCPPSDGCHWLSVTKAANLIHVFDEAGRITIAQSRFIADKIQWAGYCVEPDARFGSGSYGWGQTLGVFKPSASDSATPSTAYLGAANLLRLSVMIAAADGQIDEVELDVFRQVIENQLDLSQTDYQRLQILEKLLVKDSSSASKTLARIVKSVPAHKRLLIGKVLVRVAAADNVVTKEERRALERIFKAFEILPGMLEDLLSHACPSSQEGEARENGERFSKPVVASARRNFALDMEKVYAITNETKEVVGILSVVMQDEPEQSTKTPEVVAVPAPEVPKAHSDGKATSQPTPFNGLDAPFQPVLERLLTRDSWSRADFGALARDFSFMPLKIRDTLNEWADEVLGDFILDGEDPIVIRRDLIAE